MRAAVVEAIGGRFGITEVDVDEPRGREVLVRVMASGLCHSDLHLVRSGRGLAFPVVLGHELAGIVERLGPEVTDFVVGDHVVASLIRSCGECRQCTQGRTYRCEQPERTSREAGLPSRLSCDGQAVSSGFGTAGFAQLAIIHENQLAAVPKTVPFPQASLLGCGCITGVGAALNTAGVKRGSSVVVIGVGGVGLNVISGARIAGAAQIIAVDLQPKKAAIAREFGATDFLAADTPDLVSSVQQISGGGADYVFEVVGLKATSEQAIGMARRGGNVLLVGLHKPASKIEIDVVEDLIARQITVQGVFMGSCNIKEHIPRFAQLYLDGQLNLDGLISREIALDDINEAYEELERGEIARSVITRF